jgi:hypothetical protein
VTVVLIDDAVVGLECHGAGNERTAVRSCEAQVGAGPAVERVATFVHRPVVKRTEQHEVVEARATAVDSVPHMMGMQMAGGVTAGKLTRAVS